MDRHELIAIVVLAIVGVTTVFTAATRFHEGRCRPAAGRMVRGGMDCSWPARSDWSTGR